MYYFLACRYSAKYSCHVKLQDELNFMFSYYFLIYVFWIQASATDEAIALLLFEWAVSKYRVGKFRALAVAKTLQRRQAEILDEVRHTVHVHTIVMSKYATECNITEGQYFEFTKLCSACSFYKPFETIFLLNSPEREFSWSRRWRGIIKYCVCWRSATFPKGSHEFSGQLCSCSWYVFSQKF